MLSPRALTPRPERTEPAHCPDGITVLGVQFASIRSLFAPLIDRADLTFVHVNDWLNDLRYCFRPGAFVNVERLAGVDWREWRFPPGWTNRLAPWVMPRLANRIERAWREQGRKNPRLVVTFPYFLPLVRALGPERVIYYAVDNYQAYWPDRAAALCKQENELITDAAATIAASSALAEWFRARVPAAADRIHYLPNGVRPDMICALEVGVAERSVSASPPVVGYYGNIGSGSGIELLKTIIARLQDFRFLLIGQVLSQDVVAQLSKFPNVIMTGHVEEPDSLRFLCQCNVMIIPMPLDDHGRYASPNRLWTYMATGRPIVSTPIPEVIKFSELVLVAADADEFVGALRRAADENDLRRTVKRLEIAKQHTWPVLSQRLWSIIGMTG